MKRKILLLLFTTMITITAKAQSDSLIIGDWVYKEPYNKAKVKDAGLEEMFENEMIKNMTFNFSSDKKFDGYAMGKNQAGTWELSKNSKKIILTDDQSNRAEFNVLKLTDDEFALKLGMSEFLMVRRINKK